ncbi:MAG TPA: helix-turn-helix domain-containing protein [Prolixibacteraceae bacterium]|nr:helix-turn-helix domain-containing protein [Prolixibacteraceae bacterium]HRV89092.1 helix-turn-helix domain-containing protein [Prolixibacteraceae bacterium]
MEKHFSIWENFLKFSKIQNHEDMDPSDENLSMEQAFLRKLNDTIYQNLSKEDFGVKELSHEMNMSRSTLLRKVKKETHNSVNQYIRQLRLERAMEMLQDNVASVSEIAFQTGFGSPAYFNTCFHHYFGFPPGEVKKMKTLTSKQGIPETESNAKPNKKRSTGKNSFRWMIPVSVVLIVGITSIFFILPESLKTWFPGNSGAMGNKVKSIAVLPFKNLSEDKEFQYFADGVMEDILVNLSYVKDFKVVSRTSVETFRENAPPLPEISRKLNVDYILEGSVQSSDSQLRVRIQFIEARTDSHLFSETFDRDLSDIFSIQSEIARKISRELQATLSEEEIEHIEKMPTRNMEAYKQYLMGRYFWNKRDKASQLKSIACFENALAIDSTYTLAYAGLADAYFILTWWDWYPRQEGYLKAKKLALKALEMDRELAEAHATLGGIFCYGDWNWLEARKELERAIKINPNYVNGYQYYAEFLDIINDREGARKSIDKALELDPYAYMPNVISAICYSNEGKLDESIKARYNILEIYPDKFEIYYSLFQNYILKKDSLKALETFKKYWMKETPSEITVHEIENVYKKSGIRGLVEMCIESELGNPRPSPYVIAIRYAMLGEKEKTLTFLEKAMEERIPALPRINSNPLFDNLRSEPRFKRLIEEMGLTRFGK